MDDYLWPLASVVLGLVVGSFLNVVIHRLPLMMEEAEETNDESARPCVISSRLSLARPRSHCPKCDHRISVIQNIPLVSYCILGGACAACGARISIRYPIVELLAAAAALVSVLVFGPTAHALTIATFLWFAIVIGFIDVEHLLVPDALSLSLLWMGLACNAFHIHAEPSDAILGAIAGYASLWGLNAVAERLLGRVAIGQGDFKLFAAIGAWMGWQALAPVLFVASATGAVLGYLLIWMGRSRKGQPICFAPFLMIGAVMILLSGQSLTLWLGTLGYYFPSP